MTLRDKRTNACGHVLLYDFLSGWKNKTFLILMLHLLLIHEYPFQPSSHLF